MEDSKNLISRQAAIDTVDEMPIMKDNNGMEFIEKSLVKTRIGLLPSAEPEIVRCRDCKYSDENWRRVSVKWLPCMDVRTGSNWFCGSAERKDGEAK